MEAPYLSLAFLAVLTQIKCNIIRKKKGWIIITVMMVTGK